MSLGGWVPIDKQLINFLPKDRPYTKLEAMFSLQVDYNCGKSATISGYANLWQWSRKKVTKFFNDIGIEIIYPENTQKKQNQKGQIRVQIRDRSGTDKGQINFIDFNELHIEKNRSGTDKGQIRDRSGSTTINNKNKKDISMSLGHKKNSTIPYDAIIGLYHKILPELPEVRKLTSKRKSQIKARWNEKIPTKKDPNIRSDSLEYWEIYFSHIRTSKFLMGESKTQWMPNLEWLTNETNFINIIEGSKYF